MENSPNEPSLATDQFRTTAPQDTRIDLKMPVVLWAGVELISGFHLDGRLGCGGFGEVWRATGPGGVPVALKIIQVEQGLADVEARALSFMKLINHPHLVTIFGIWSTERHLIVGMELADGTLMDQLQAALTNGQSGVPPQNLIDPMIEVAKGIDFLNEPRHTVEGRSGVSIIHRDIKPQNILLFGGGVKIADFGLANTLERSLPGKASGLTPSYAPPEFFQNGTAKQSDQYSLAVSYYQLRIGVLPFRGSPYQVMAAQIGQKPDLSMLPPEEQAVVGRALAKAPSDRWPTCRAFADQLAEAIKIDVPPPQPELPALLTNSIGMRLVQLSAGSFVMGSPETEPGRRRDEGPQHQVTISDSFYLGAFCVTQGEYLAIMGQNPARFQENQGGGLDYPVENVSWFEAQEFCRKLSARFAEKHAGRWYYLPTEAEWEYACRAGTQTRYSTGVDLSFTQARFKSSTGKGESSHTQFIPRTSSVSTHQPNRFGLSAMHGNVAEWCSDFYGDDYYQNSPEYDPLGPRSGGRRVIRGGHWNLEVNLCRSACRGKVAPHSCTPFVGFRVVMIHERFKLRD